MKRFLSLSLVVGLGSLTVLAQGPMRGEEEIKATQHSLKMELIVDEMEDAGFVLDVEEGFDEEWEEGTWIADGEELDVAVVRQEDAEMLDLEEITLLDEEAALAEEEESWEAVDEVVVEMEEEVVLLTEEVEWEAELEDPFAAEEMLEEEAELEEAWWNEDSRDASWDELMDEWELEALENSYEEEDLDVLEAMYEKG